MSVFYECFMFLGVFLRWVGILSAAGATGEVYLLLNIYHFDGIQCHVKSLKKIFIYLKCERHQDLILFPQIIRAVQQLNRDKNVHGIIVQVC